VCVGTLLVGQYDGLGSHSTGSMCRSVAPGPGRRVRVPRLQVRVNRAAVWAERERRVVKRDQAQRGRRSSGLDSPLGVSAFSPRRGSRAGRVDVFLEFRLADDADTALVGRARPRRVISASVRVVEDTYGGTPCASASSLRHWRRAFTAPRLYRQRRRADGRLRGSYRHRRTRQGATSRRRAKGRSCR